MARELDSRLKINGTLTAQTALHVGGHGESPDTDLPLAQNGAGKFYIPGTSIAGVLRAWCEKNFDKTEIAKLFGPKHKRGDADGHASYVIVEDIELPNELQSEIRDGVGIDRFYGVAAERAKFDRAVLPRGTELKICLTVEIEKRRKIEGKDKAGKAFVRDETDDERTSRIARTKAILGYLLSALQTGEIRFGASRTRGLGRVTLTKLKEIEVQEFNKILSWLNSNQNVQSFTDKTQIANEIDKKLSKSAIANPSSQLLEIKIAWRPKSALMVKAGYEGIGVDMLPLVSGNGKDNVSLCLPGSSIKGALRAHAERIIRTLRDSERKTDFHEQIKLPLVIELFGAKKETDGQATHLGLGALSVDDCYAEKQFNAELWREVEVGKVYGEKSYDEEVKKKNANGQEVEVTLWQALKKIDGSGDLKSNTENFRISHHVAIDRWTGGASEGALYSVLQPTPLIEWQDISLTLDFARLQNADGSLNQSLQKKCLMLLLLVLRDMAENRLPLGFATNRGMGEVRIGKICFRGSGLSGGLECLNRNSSDWLILSEGRFSCLDQNLKKDLREEWLKWMSTKN
jgi:CRISPR/Cas system CSM-associated protein Csm3 (group 7 of RAMP superfamily)